MPIKRKLVASTASNGGTKRLNIDLQEVNDVLLPLDVWRIVFDLVKRSDWLTILCLNKKLSAAAIEVFIKRELEESTVDISDFIDKAIPEGIHCVDFEVPVLPYIEACGVVVSFPVSESNSKALIEKSEITPFGKGMQTLIDPNIRKGWQIDASLINIHGRRWKDLFSNSQQSSLLEQIRDAIAPNSTAISAELYKLLIYGKGDKFTTHKDTIRGKNHFGSLVVFLPSAYTGGDFVVKHRSSVHTFNYSLSSPACVDNPNSIHCVAFFTDCEHEVLEVESGYRVCLTYHLFYSGDVKPALPLVCDKRLFEGKLKTWWENAVSEQNRSKLFGLGFLLDHAYSMDTLDLNQLKGRDSTLCQVLKSLDLGWAMQFVPVDIKIEGNFIGKAKCKANHEDSWCADESDIGNVKFAEVLNLQRDAFNHLTVESSEAGPNGEDISFDIREEYEWKGTVAFALDFNKRRADDVVRIRGEISGNVGSESHSLCYTAAAVIMIPPKKKE